MKNFSSVLNVILLLAVAVLFYLHFTSNKTQPQPEVVDDGGKVDMPVDSLTQFMNLDSNIAAKPIKIAYVNNDSLSENLDLMKDVVDKIAAKEKKIRANIQNRGKSYERDYERKLKALKKRNDEYMLKMATMTDAQLDAEKAAMTKMQQELMQMEQTLQQKLYEFQQTQEQDYMLMKAKEMGDYYLKVQSFCKSIAKTLGFDFILIYQEGGSILYSNPEYDVTNYVVDAINKEYSQNKSK